MLSRFAAWPDDFSFTLQVFLKKLFHLEHETTKEMATSSTTTLTGILSSPTFLKHSQISAFSPLSSTSLRAQHLLLHTLRAHSHPIISYSRSSSSNSPSPAFARAFGPRPQLRSSSRQILAGSGAPVSRGVPETEGEEVFFDGGVHIGDLVVNLLLGFTLVWLPLTLAAVFRGMFLRYRFTDVRVTVLSGLLGGDRKDFSYDVVKDVKIVPRFVGEWGDMAIELKDGTVVDIRGVPRFREIADYVEQRAAGGKRKLGNDPSASPAKTGAARKGFS